MTITEIEKNYNKYYKSISFERTELFISIKELFNPTAVLYIGSSIHITPSFVFQNVTYIDKDPFVEKFFSYKQSLIEFIGRNKKYKQNPHFDFIKYNFLQPYELLKNKYDLVLSIYSTNKIGTAAIYTKNNGIIVFLPLSTDAPLTFDKLSLRLIGFIESKKNKYHCIQKPKKNKANCNGIMKNNKFKDNNLYTIYRKIEN